MARIPFSTCGDTPFQKLLGHRPPVETAWAQLGECLEMDGALPADLKEQVRRTLAQGHGCKYCQAKGKPDPSVFDENTSLAAGFAEVILKQNGYIQETIFQVLLKHFTVEQICELCAFISFATASQLFGQLMDLKPGDWQE